MKWDYSKEVIELAQVDKPFAQPTAKAWAIAERDTGLKFPSDYKKLVSTLGTGRFGVAFHLRNPALTWSRHLYLSKQSLSEFERLLAETTRAANVALYPRLGGLIHIGGMERQLFFWRPNRDQLTNRIVWLDVDSDETMEIEMSITQFIYRLYRGLIDEKWAEELRNYIWFERCAFFTPSKLSKLQAET